MQSRHLPLSLSTVFLDCIALQVDRAAFHETVAAERARELLAREKELQEARLREAALEQHIRQLEQEVGAVRDAARAVRREEADQSQVVEGLQQQLEQMQLLALSQSREAETAMVAIADFKGVRVCCCVRPPRPAPCPLAVPCRGDACRDLSVSLRRLLHLHMSLCVCVCVCVGRVQSDVVFG